MSNSDQETADKFSNSWNNVYDASVYSESQFEDWIHPWTKSQIQNKSVLELGCGSGALLYHMFKYSPKKLIGIDLGNSTQTARKLLPEEVIIENADLTDSQSLIERFGKQDKVYSIGVLHHLTEPEMGFNSMIEVTKPNGNFHGWVYAHEGNSVIRYFVDPLRKVVNHLPWYLNKFLIALPLSIPFFLYSKFCKFISKLFKRDEISFLPLFSYMMWISKRNFQFHHHVAFDQLVTPVTHYLKKEKVEQWLKHPDILQGSTYLIFRNGNSWKFGGQKR